VINQINMKGLDGIQGPVYVGTGCVFRRQALYGYNPPKGPKRPKMVTCDCCPCFGRKKRKHAKDGLPEGTADIGEFQFQFQMSETQYLPAQHSVKSLTRCL